MSSSTWRRLAAIAAATFTAILLLVGCQGVGSPYFAVGDETRTGVPASPGETVYIGLMDLVTPEARQVDLLQLSVLGLPPDVQADAFVLDRAQTGGGGIGAAREDEGDAMDLIPMLQPLRGYRLLPQQVAVQVVVRLSAPAATTVFAFEKVALSFFVQGGQQLGQEFPNGGKVWYCADGSKCPEPSAESTPFVPTASSGITQPEPS